jgi:SAM-dependent methyltransferase
VNWSPLTNPRFSRTAAYHPDWILSTVSGGANSLWLAEWLSEAMDLRPGMRVLDLGCGMAASSIFLHREFGVQVWAADLWISVDDNRRRIEDAGFDDDVFPLHLEARALPFASEFFDAIVCIDSIPYFGTDEFWLGYVARFVKPEGRIGFAGAGLMREIEGELPEHLKTWWQPDLWSLHSPAWWRRHWEKTGFVDVEVSDTLEDGWKRWLDWHRLVAPDNAVEIAAVGTDAGEYLGYVRAVASRRCDAEIPEQIVSVPTEYRKASLLRTSNED